MECLEVVCTKMGVDLEQIRKRHKFRSLFPQQAGQVVNINWLKKSCDKCKDDVS